MPANKTNYIVLYEGLSQIYGSGTKEIALSSPPPPGMSLKDKHILFVTYEPDNEVISVHELPKDEVESAEIKYPKTWKKDRIDKALRENK